MGRFDLQPRKPKKSAAAPPPPPPVTQRPASAPKVRPARGRPATGGKTFIRGFWQGAIAFVALALFGIGVALIGYAAIAWRLDDPRDLASRASSFQSLRILDREGNLLAESFDPNEGRRTVVLIDRISPYLLQATVSTEDANFYDHQGVDPIALARALYYAVLERDIVSGASTIPQQLVKMVYLSPEYSLTRKIKEAILSTEISRRFSKEDILQLYLNEIYYGNLAYGIDAAAHTYFNKDADQLTLGEASLLAGLPQLPSAYDPYINKDAARNRQAVVLALMVENGYITPAEADAAYLEDLTFAPLSYDMEHPHFTLFVRQQLEAQFDQDIFKLGLEVTTTLDPNLQVEAERIVADQVARLADRNVSNGALVAMRPATGEIVAFVGSADFDNVEIDGQVNMALAPRQPGSSIKPLVYLASFEQPEKPASERWTPGTLIADIKQEFPDGADPPYVPTNYDLREHGMVTMRTALANSYNIPAVRALQTVELPDFLELTKRLGITTLTRPDYGLSLALGGGEVPLIEMTGAYAVLANGGKRVPPVAILKVTDSAGNVLCEQGSDTPCQPSTVVSGQQVVSPVDAFLITDVLSDNEARALAFGPNSVLQLDRPAAVKTGTTNDFRDNLTMGFTPQLVTGVWIGNANNSEMRDISGVSGAGPIWGEFMTYAHRDLPVEQFIPPGGVRQFEVCRDTGTMPSEACPERRQYWFAEDRPPLPADRDLYQIVRFDRNSGQLANEFTLGDTIEEKVFKVYPEPYRKWAEEHGIPQPPVNPDDVFEFSPELHIRQPIEGEVVSGIVPIFGSANAPGFRSFELQYGVSHDPGAFSEPFSGPSGTPVIDGLLGEWDARGLGEGPHTIRLVVYGENNAVYEQKVRLFVAAATPTPEPTMTWTPPPPTLTFTPVPEQPTETALPTDTPLPVDTVAAPPTDTPWPTDTVAAPPADTPLPTDTAAAPATDTPLPTDTPAVPVEPVITETPTITPTAELSEVPTASSIQDIHPRRSHAYLDTCTVKYDESTAKRQPPSHFLAGRSATKLLQIDKIIGMDEYIAIDGGDQQRDNQHIPQLPAASAPVVLYKRSPSTSKSCLWRRHLALPRSEGEQMVNRLALAQRFVDAKRQERDDIIAVLLEGSVPRGEDSEASDIDIMMIVAGEERAGAFDARGGANTWLEGIYIDAVVRSQSDYGDLQAVLQDPFKATHMNDALIFYDPTGHFTQLQQAVRAAYMQPHWLGVRLQYWLNQARPQVSGLQEAVASGDALAICQYPGLLTFALVSIPLLRLGITPSSSRNLVQLGSVSKQLQERFCTFEGSNMKSAEAVLALSPLFFDWVTLADFSKWGYLPDYFAKKAVWMAQHQLHQEAIHAFWLTVSVIAGECLLSEERAVKALPLAQSWLQGVNWVGEEVIASKVSQARSLLSEIEMLAADLPTYSAI